MNLFDWLVLAVAGVVGWLLVSYLLSRTKPEERKDPVPPGTAPGDARPALAAPEVNTSNGLSIEELGRTWHTILGVPGEASGAEIERAYHAKLAECDHTRFAPDATVEQQQQAQQRRARISQAFEFIRPLRN